MLKGRSLWNGKQYERYLREKMLERQNLYTKNRGLKLPFSKENVKIGLNGKNLYTTIDSEIQFILNDEVRKKFISSGSEEAYGLVMNPNNGQIIATAYHTTNKKH